MKGDDIEYEDIADRQMDTALTDIPLERGGRVQERGRVAGKLAADGKLRCSEHDGHLQPNGCGACEFVRLTAVPDQGRMPVMHVPFTITCVLFPIHRAMEDGTLAAAAHRLRAMDLPWCDRLLVMVDTDEARALVSSLTVSVEEAGKARARERATRSEATGQDVTATVPPTAGGRPLVRSEHAAGATGGSGLREDERIYVSADDAIAHGATDEEYRSQLRRRARAGRS